IRSRTASRRAGSAQKPAPPCRTASYPAERGILPAYAEASRLSGIRMAGRRQVPPPLSARTRGKILAAETETPRPCRCRSEEVAEPEAVEIGGAKPVAQGESFFGAVVFGVDVDAEGPLSFREVHDPGDLAGEIGWVRAGSDIAVCLAGIWSRSPPYSSSYCRATAVSAGCPALA